jgi:hypothetical protein
MGWDGIYDRWMNDMKAVESISLWYSNSMVLFGSWCVLHHRACVCVLLCAVYRANELLRL